MASTFMESAKYLLASESVTEGHPDKVCDQISDAILDAIMAQDPMGRVACETAVTTGLVVVLGELPQKPMSMSRMLCARQSRLSATPTPTITSITSPAASLSH